MELTVLAKLHLRMASTNSWLIKPQPIIPQRSSFGMVVVGWGLV